MVMEPLILVSNTSVASVHNLLLLTVFPVLWILMSQPAASPPGLVFSLLRIHPPSSDNHAASNGQEKGSGKT